MKIGIVTQPLKINYGGILQNWALQQTLIKMGHEPVTIDYHHNRSLVLWASVNIKNLLQLIRGNSTHFNYFERCYVRPHIYEDFVSNNIKLTNTVKRYSSSTVEKEQFDVIIVGSDQVWRPLYNKRTLFDMFLKFVPSKVKKISYAASFGVDRWEYTGKETRKCKQLIQRFDAVSVREPSGVPLCKDYLNVDAVHVLDPTLLLEKKDYLDLIADISPLCKNPFLVAYILDATDEQMDYIQNKAEELGLTLKFYSASEESVLSPKQWLSMFRDADYIITDSFHGAVFSLIFEKPFEVLGNFCRGNARFDMLREIKMENNLSSLRRKSLSWLQNNLSKR